MPRVRVRDYDLGDGKVYVLDAPSEVDQIPRRLRELVPARMLDVFARFPGSLLEPAARTRIRPFSAWLRQAAASRPSIAVYDPADNFPARAFLALDFGPRSTAGGELPWIVLLDLAAGGPRRRPPALAEVHGVIGGLVLQYGGSGTLISPPEIGTLAKLPRATRDWLFGDDATARARVDPKGWRPWLECDGDYLCYRADGRSRWFGHEWGAPTKMMSTRRCLEDLFTVLLAKREFSGHMHEWPREDAALP